MYELLACLRQRKYYLELSREIYVTGDTNVILGGNLDIPLRFRATTAASKAENISKYSVFFKAFCQLDIQPKYPNRLTAMLLPSGVTSGLPQIANFILPRFESIHDKTLQLCQTVANFEVMFSSKSVFSLSRNNFAYIKNFQN